MRFGPFVSPKAYSSLPIQVLLTSLLATLSDSADGPFYSSFLVPHFVYICTLLFAAIFLEFDLFRADMREM